MQLVTPKDVLEFCQGLTPPFSRGAVEVGLGLPRSALQGLFGTRAFNKEGSGYVLATGDYDTFCILAGINHLQPTKFIKSPRGSNLDLNEKFAMLDKMDIHELKEYFEGMTYRDAVARIIAGRATEDDRAYGTAFLYMLEYALADPRYAIAPETIWESRPL
jgi:hypothetical protein